MAEFEQDPVADFLAREAEVLGGLEEDDMGEPATNGPSEITEEGQEMEAEIDVQAGGEPAATSQTNGPTDGWAEISHVDKVRAEPEKIKKWREEQKKRLEEKDEEDELKKGDWREAAKKELEQWYEKQAEQLKKTKANNRETEQIFLDERDKGVPGKEWEKISRLCDFNPKTAKHSKDISRMKSIILQLKSKSGQNSV